MIRNLVGILGLIKKKILLIGFLMMTYERDMVRSGDRVGGKERESVKNSPCRS